MLSLWKVTVSERVLLLLNYSTEQWKIKVMTRFYRPGNTAVDNDSIDAFKTFSQKRDFYYRRYYSSVYNKQDNDDVFLIIHPSDEKKNCSTHQGNNY